MSPKQLCDAYLAALNDADLQRVISLFEPGAKVVSPLYGTMPVAPFYADLFSDTNRSETRFINLFDSSSEAPAVALHFHYRWTLKGGELVEFDCVDVFALNADRSKFAGLSIIYDTAPLRAAFQAVHTHEPG